MVTILTTSDLSRFFALAKFLFYNTTLLVSCIRWKYVYTPIAFDERVTLWLQRARSLPCVCAFAALYAYVIAWWSYASLRPIMQHMHTHKAVTGRVKAKKVTLSSKAIKLYQLCNIQWLHNFLQVSQWLLIIFTITNGQWRQYDLIIRGGGVGYSNRVYGQSLKPHPFLRIYLPLKKADLKFFFEIFANQDPFLRGVFLPQKQLILPFFS